MNITKREIYALQVTYFRHNYGSVLQAYATRTFLKQYGINTILVEENLTYFERVCFALTRRGTYFIKALMYPDIKKERELQIQANRKSIEGIDRASDHLIDVFIDKYLNTINLSYAELSKLAKTDECLYCIAGSDQIWNASRVYVNPIYFLSFSPKSKRIALAPSFGSDHISEYNISTYKKYISQFDRLSIRESSGLKVIKDLCERSAKPLLDPVLLLRDTEWKTIINNEIENTLNDAVFAFFLNKPSTSAEASIRKLISEGFKVVTIGYGANLDACAIDYELITGGPGVFLELINRCKLICTDSFHATVFSMIFHKPFYTFNRSYISSSQATRLTEILNAARLIDRYEPQSVNSCEIETERFQIFEEMVRDNKDDTKAFLGV